MKFKPVLIMLMLYKDKCWSERMRAAYTVTTVWFEREMRSLFAELTTIFVIILSFFFLYSPIVSGVFGGIIQANNHWILGPFCLIGLYGCPGCSNSPPPPYFSIRRKLTRVVEICMGSKVTKRSLISFW